MEEGLSIIIPTCNEYPQVAFTLQTIHDEFHNSIDVPSGWEVLLIDNWCPEVAAQGREQDKTATYFPGLIKRGSTPWLKYHTYTEKLSHWNAKNVGIQNARFDTLLFLDAHVTPRQSVIRFMYYWYNKHQEKLNGSLHLPISYLLEAPGRENIYRARISRERGVLHYTFNSFGKYRDKEEPFAVPCMSTCGMMIDTVMMKDLIKCWPAELGIYGGGENFLNYVMAILGKKVSIFPYPAINHFAETRGYAWNWLDHKRNQMIATYLAAGKEWLERFCNHICSDPRMNQRAIERTKRNIVSSKSLLDRRAWYKKNQQISIEDWIEMWKDSPLMEMRDK